MELKDIKALIRLLSETDVTEFELKEGEQTVLIRRGPSREVMTYMAPPVVAASPAPNPAPAAAPAPATAAAPAGKYETINSPMVGTFYRKPSPEAEYFVQVGSTVDSGQTLCLVEAMKLFNEIEAEFRCKIVEILKEDAQPVEFGEPLFRVERL